MSCFSSTCLCSLLKLSLSAQTFTFTTLQHFPLFQYLSFFAVKFTKSKAKVTLMWGFLFRAIERILCLEWALFVTGMLHRPQLLRLKSLRRKCAFWRRRNTVSEKRKILLSVESVGQSHSGQLPRQEWLLPSWSPHTSKFLKMEQISKVKVALLQADAWGSKSQSSRPTLHCV